MSESRRHVLGFLARAAAAGLAVAGIPSPSEARAHDAIIGAWMVQISSTSAPYAGVQVIHRDGTLALTFAPSGPAASGAPPRLYATGYGAWSKTSDGGYDFTLTALSVTSDGLYQGQVAVNGHAQLDDSRQSFAATYTSRSTNSDGGLVGNNSGAISGTRISLGV